MNSSALPGRAAQQADGAAGPSAAPPARLPYGPRRSRAARMPGVGQPWLPGAVAHGDHGQREPGQAAVEVGPSRSHFSSRHCAPSATAASAWPSRASVYATPASPCRGRGGVPLTAVRGPRDEPFLVLRHAHARRLGQREQHAGRAVREAEPAARDAELVDVAGEEPVLRSGVALARIAPTMVRRQPRPSARRHRCPGAAAARGAPGRRTRPGRVSRTAAGPAAGDLPYRLVKEPVRDGEQCRRSPPRAAPPCPCPAGTACQRQEHRQSHAREAVGVDIEPRPVTGRGEPGVADGADAVPR